MLARPLPATALEPVNGQMPGGEPVTEGARPRTATKRLGDLGEAAVAEELQRYGLRVLARNYRCPAGEVDVVAEDGDTLVFVEVKTRRDVGRGLPQEAVTWRKQQKLGRTAMWYCHEHDQGDRGCRFDVAAVVVVNGEIATVEHFPNAFVPEGEG